MDAEVRATIWQTLFASSTLWIVQSSHTQTGLARKTAGGVLQTFTAFHRFSQRLLLESGETPQAFVHDATYPGIPLIRRPIPAHPTATLAWPEPAPPETLVIVDWLNPRRWEEFQAWRGPHAALIILSVDDGAWIPPGVGSWVLNVSDHGFQRYRPPRSEKFPETIIG